MQFLKKLALGLSLFILIDVANLARAEETAWEVYLNYPSSENASQVTSIQSSRGASPSSGIGSSSELVILRLQIVAGDRQAFRMALRLASIADGGVLEDLYGLLATAIRPQPKMFLEEIEKMQVSTRVLESVLSMSGPEYVDRFEAQKYELKMRRVALQSITQKHLKSTQKKSMQILDAELARRGSGKPPEKPSLSKVEFSKK